MGTNRYDRPLRPFNVVCLMQNQSLRAILYDNTSPSVNLSLLNSIVNERGSRTVGTSEEVSTVGIELRRHRQRNGRTVEFYDCAGQVDYYRMHQTFLTRRALYLLVWDVSRCHGKEGNNLDKVSV